MGSTASGAVGSKFKNISCMNSISFCNACFLTTFSADNACFHFLLMSSTTSSEVVESVISPVAAKPKRELTEAQRLAFMKGREKRLANLQARKAEKKMMEQELELPPPEPVPEVVRQPLRETPAPTAVRQEFDEGALIDKITTRLVAELKPPKKPRKPRAPSRRHEPELEPIIETPLPRRTFKWA